ncbi:MAG: ABC transporter permease [Anaerolineae bacterium]|nr:ABC transporter permease [Anaerolineae bacterium]
MPLIANMSISRLLAVIRKELRHITRDARILFLVTVAPAFLLVTLSYVFALDVGRINVAVQDMDRTSLSRDFIASLSADEDFVIVAYLQRSEEVEPLLVRGAADLVLVIPHGFTDAALAGGPAEMQCIVDGSDSITAGQTLGLLQQRVTDFVADLLGQRSVDVGIGLRVDDRAWYNETLKSLVSMVPGMLAVIMCMPALALTLALAREKETGSFEGLIATPVRRTEYLVGKLAAYVIGGMASLVVAWFIAMQWFRVPFRGGYLDFLLLAAVYLFASMGVSLLVANFVRNQQTAMFLVLMIFFIPSFFLAGLITPVSDEPIAQAVAYALPTTHFIAICRGVFLKGLGVGSLWRQASILLGTGVVSLAGSLALLRKKIR